MGKCFINCKKTKSLGLWCNHVLLETVIYYFFLTQPKYSRFSFDVLHLFTPINSHQHPLHFVRSSFNSLMWHVLVPSLHTFIRWARIIWSKLKRKAIKNPPNKHHHCQLSENCLVILCAFLDIVCSPHAAPISHFSSNRAPSPHRQD